MNVLNSLDNEVCAVVIASGKSRRMHKNKLLMKLNHRLMVDYALNLAELPEFSKSFVVTCYPEIEALAKKKNISVIWNEHSDEGQSVSVVLGAKAVYSINQLKRTKLSGVTEKADINNGKNTKRQCAVMYFNGDMPYLQKDTVTKLIKTFKKTGKIIVPTYGQRPGNPVIFPSRYLPELMQLTGDAGGRRVIQKYQRDVVFVPICNEQEGMDVDDSERFKEAEAYFNEHQ